MNTFKNLTICFIVVALAYLATDKITERNIKKECNDCNATFEWCNGYWREKKQCLYRVPSETTTVDIEALQELADNELQEGDCFWVELHEGNVSIEICKEN